jgi:hypothetical protein
MIKKIRWDPQNLLSNVCLNCLKLIMKRFLFQVIGKAYNSLILWKAQCEGIGLLHRHCSITLPETLAATATSEGTMITDQAEAEVTLAPLAPM